MAIFINTNIAALNAQRNLGVTGMKMAKALERLSSGLRVNRAADDAAGLAISEKMRSQIRGTNQGLRNAQDAISMLQTAEGALNEVHAILQRMRELSVQAGSTHLSPSDRTAIGEEVTSLRNEIDNIASRTRFNGLNLLQGTLSVTSASMIVDVTDAADTATVSYDVTGANANTTYNITSGGANVTVTNATTNVAQTITVASMADGGFQTLDFNAIGVKLTLADDLGAGDGLAATDIAAELAGASIVTDANQGNATFRVGPEKTDNITVGFSDMRSSALGVVGSELNIIVTDNQVVSTIAKADTLLDSLDKALDQISTQRAKLGAAQNQVEAAVNSLGIAVENLTASESRIRDADVASLSSELVTRQIMLQAGVAVLAQANTSAQAVLTLLQG